MIGILVGFIAWAIMFVRFCFFFVIYEDKKSIQTWVALVMVLGVFLTFDSEVVIALVPWVFLIILLKVQHEPLQEKSMFEDIDFDDPVDEQYKTKIEFTTVKPASPKPKLVYQDGKQV